MKKSWSVQIQIGFKVGGFTLKLKECGWPSVCRCSHGENPMWVFQCGWKRYWIDRKVNPPRWFQLQIELATTRITTTTRTPLKKNESRFLSTMFSIPWIPYGTHGAVLSETGIAWAIPTVGQNQVILRDLIIHFPTSSGVSEWASYWMSAMEHASKASSASKWTSTYVPILGFLTHCAIPVRFAAVPWKFIRNL